MNESADVEEIESFSDLGEETELNSVLLVHINE